MILKLICYGACMLRRGTVECICTIAIWLLELKSPLKKLLQLGTSYVQKYLKCLTLHIVMSKTLKVCG